MSPSIADDHIDVALSFVNEDLHIARDINELICDHLTTFFYPENEKENLGKSGHQSLPDIYGKRARLVVILHRSTWGEVGFTQIEKTALQNRQFEMALETFALFIDVDESAPALWIPRSLLRPNLSRIGVQAVAAVIEERAIQLGAQVKDVGLEATLRRVKRGHDFDARREEYFQDQGQTIRDYRSEFSKLKALIETKIQELGTSVAFLSWRVRNDDDCTFHIFGKKLSARVSREGYVFQSQNLPLRVKILSGTLLNESRWQEKPVERKNLAFKFDLAPQGGFIWVDGRREFSTPQLAEHILTSLADAFEQWKHEYGITEAGSQDPGDSEDTLGFSWT